MGKVVVSKLRPGNRLKEDVMTSYGNLLLPKGKLITERDIQILKSFSIEVVEIQMADDEVIQQADMLKNADNDPLTHSSAFKEAYSKTFRLLKQCFSNASAGTPLPILELREHLNELIGHISEYHVLTFVPHQYHLDDYIYHNSIMVGLTGYLLAGWADFPKKDLVPIALSGLLHDIGNQKVDPDLLYKPEKLTSEELKEVQQHTVYGYEILKNVAGINEGTKLSALQHHEREDGTGYPLGLNGSKIHIYAKVVAIADMFHAMTNKRHHKDAKSPYLVLEELLNDSFGKLDPALVRTFVNKVTQLQQGMIVRLSDDRVGEIVFTEPNHPTRPFVKVNNDIVNLASNRALHIIEVMNV